jgi:cyclohexadieny/prephenate dehydrogenase
MFKKISIIGMGLIGSSLARVIREKGLCKTLVAIDTDKGVCDTVVRLNLADEVTDVIADGVQDADLVVICTPVGAISAVGEMLKSSVKAGAIVTDVGSVKGTVIEKLSGVLPEGVHFVPGHPIAGTEYSGPESGFSTLFKDRWCVLTPLPKTEIKAIEAVTHLWEAAGSTVEIMDPEQHDLVLAITSHLPHLIAYTIVGTATDLEDETKSEVIKFSASGFRDFTRIAASDPVMWRDVFLSNREATLDVVERFIEDLTALKRAIRWSDGDMLLEHFAKTRDIRRRIVESGQDEPNFGRDD